MKEDDDAQIRYLERWRRQQIRKKSYQAAIHMHWRLLRHWIIKYIRKDWKHETNA